MEYDAVMTQRQSLAALLAQVGVSVAALVGATVLCAMGKLEGEALVALYTAALALASTGAAATARQAINGGPKPDLTKLAQTHPEMVERMSPPSQPQPVNVESR